MMFTYNMRKHINKGISTPVGILIIILVAVILGGGILAWQYLGGKKTVVTTPTPTIAASPTSTPDETTEVIKYIPTDIPSEIKEGYCWVNSISVPRKGAWRCMTDSSISDPCFVINGSENLVCDSNPITGDKGFLLKLTKPLPEDTATDNYGQGWGWLIQLEDGTACGFITGATGVINNKRINYGCSDDSYIIGDLDVGTIWKAEKVDNLQTKSTEMVSIKKVWQ
jgi:hypothetical protein